MFQKQDDQGYHCPIPGIRMKTLVHGEKTLLAEFHLEKGAVLPLHSHPHEQTGYLVSGSMRLTIGDAVHDVGPGDGWCVPEDVRHKAEILADAVAIEVFSPVREDYLPKKATR